MVVGGARMVAIALCYMFDASKEETPESNRSRRDHTVRDH